MKDDIDFKRLKRGNSPIVVDSDSDDVRVVSKKPSSASAASPEGVEYIWLDGRGVVPLAEFMAQTAIEESGPGDHPRDVKPLASSSRQMLTPTPAIAKPPSLYTRSQIASQLKEAQACQEQHSLALEQAFKNANYAAIKENRAKISEQLKLIDQLTKRE